MSSLGEAAVGGCGTRKNGVVERTCGVIDSTPL